MHQKNVSIALSGYEFQALRYLTLMPIFQGQISNTLLEIKDILEGMVAYVSEKLSQSEIARVKFINSLAEKKYLYPINIGHPVKGEFDRKLQSKENNLNENFHTRHIIEDYLSKYGNKISDLKGGNYILRLSESTAQNLESIKKIVGDNHKDLAKRIKDTDCIKETINFIIRDFPHYWEFTEFIYLGSLFNINLSYATKLFLKSKPGSKEDSVPLLFKLDDSYMRSLPEEIKSKIDSIALDKEVIGRFESIIKNNKRPKSYSGYLEFFKTLQSNVFPFNYFTAALGLTIMIQSREFMFFDFAILSGMVLDLGFDDLGARLMQAFLDNIKVLMKEDGMSYMEKLMGEINKNTNEKKS